MSVSCSGGGDGHPSLLPTFDFHHIDAISLGTSGDLIVPTGVETSIKISQNLT